MNNIIEVILLQISSLLAFPLPPVGRGIDPITRHLDTFSLSLQEITPST